MNRTHAVPDTPRGPVVEHVVPPDSPAPAGFDTRQAARAAARFVGSGVCAGCSRRNRPIVTHHERDGQRQGFCSACNNRLIRRYGGRYGAVLENPAQALRGLEEAKADTKDRRALRRKFFDVMNLIDELEPEDRRQVMWGFRKLFAYLPEAQSFLTFDTTDGECQNVAPPPEPKLKIVPSPETPPGGAATKSKREIRAQKDRERRRLKAERTRIKAERKAARTARSSALAATPAGYEAPEVRDEQR
jgi:hypothetical protein